MSENDIENEAWRKTVISYMAAHMHNAYPYNTKEYEIKKRILLNVSLALKDSSKLNELKNKEYEIIDSKKQEIHD